MPFHYVVFVIRKFLNMKNIISGNNSNATTVVLLHEFVLKALDFVVFEGYLHKIWKSRVFWDSELKIPLYLLVVPKFDYNRQIT